MKNQSEKVETRKAMNYFAMALEIGAQKIASAQKTTINALVAAGAADPASLDAESKLKSANPEALAETYARTAAQLWASYQSQSRLGTHALAIQRRRISNMTDYFGERNETGRVFGTGRQGTPGVARLGFSVSPEDGAIPTGTFEITGSNSVIAEHVATHSGGQLDKIWLPKEVTVVVKQYRAVIAIDETNRIRDSIDWEHVARAFPQHVVLASPYRFWSHVRGTKV